MSTLKEKTKTISAEAGEEGGTHSSAHDHDESKNAVGITILFFIFGFAASLIVGWIVYPKLLYCEKKQPFDFNHALHNEMVDGCESCHFFYEDGTYAGVPKLAQCIDCHEEVQGESPDEEIFVSEYVKNEREVPWHIYSKQPDCVFFSHAAHVKKAQMDCVTCHGNTGTSTSLPVYKENWITGYSQDIWGKNIAGIKKNTWDRMKMDDCAECHKNEGMMVTSVQTGKDACFVCHK